MARASFRDFGLVLVALFCIRIILAVTLIPVGVSNIVSFVCGAIFLALPLFGLYRGSIPAWRLGPNFLLIAAGFALHIGGLLMARGKGLGIEGVVWKSLAQTGIMIWCLGLGVLVASMIKDINLILPVAVFLIGYDAFLVFSPIETPVTARLTSRSEVFENVKVTVPAARVMEPGKPPPAVQVTSTADIGPADFFFAAFFFAILSRFKLKGKETLKLMVPVLIVYLAIVLVFHVALPALVPIAGCVLWVNRGAFKLSSEERQATIGIAILVSLLAGWAIFHRLTDKPPAPQVEPLRRATAPVIPK